MSGRNVSNPVFIFNDPPSIHHREEEVGNEGSEKEFHIGRKKPLFSPQIGEPPHVSTPNSFDTRGRTSPLTPQALGVLCPPPIPSVLWRVPGFGRLRVAPNSFFKRVPQGLSVGFGVTIVGGSGSSKDPPACSQLPPLEAARFLAFFFFPLAPFPPINDREIKGITVIFSIFSLFPSPQHPGKRGQDLHQPGEGWGGEKKVLRPRDPPRRALGWGQWPCPPPVGTSRCSGRGVKKILLISDAVF